MSLSELMIDIPAEHVKNVFGQFDAYAKKIEKTLHVTLIVRDTGVKILGESKQAEKARRVLSQLTELSKRGNIITEQNVDYTISLVFEDQEGAVTEIDKELICHTLQGKPIKPKTLGEIHEKTFVLSGGGVGAAAACRLCPERCGKGVQGLRPIRRCVLLRRGNAHLVRRADGDGGKPQRKRP